MGDVGLIKVENKLTLKFVLGDLKYFKQCFFSFRAQAGRVRTLNVKLYFFLNCPLEGQKSK